MITLGNKNIGAEIAKKIRGRGEKIEQAAIRGMRSAALRGVGIVQAAISDTSPFPAEDTGRLKRSVHYVREDDGARVEVDAPHAPHIEYGTRPHTPPLEPLITWAVRKFRVPEEEALKIARGVQKKIQKEGTEPRHYMKDSIPKIEKVMMREIMAEIRKLK
jgi:hypothetical protein